MLLAMTGFSCVTYKILQKHASFFVPRNGGALFRTTWWKTCLISSNTTCMQGSVRLCRQKEAACFHLLPSCLDPVWCLPVLPRLQICTHLPGACFSVYGPLVVLEELKIHAFLWTSKALWLAMNASTYCTCLKIVPCHPLFLSSHSWCWFSSEFCPLSICNDRYLLCFLFTEWFTDLLLPSVCCHLLRRSHLPVFCPAWNKKQDTQWDQPSICKKE